MEITTNCQSIEEVRSNIDAIDMEIVKLISNRGKYVLQAAKFKKNENEVKAPQRVEQIIQKVVNLTEKFDGNSFVVEKVYRAMISAFIESELVEHKKITEK